MLARCIYCIVASTYQVPQASSKVPPYNTIVRFLPLVIDHNPRVINHNLGNKMLGQAGPNSITQVMIYNLGYNL